MLFILVYGIYASHCLISPKNERTCVQLCKITITAFYALNISGIHYNQNSKKKMNQVLSSIFTCSFFHRHSNLMRQSLLLFIVLLGYLNKNNMKL